MNVHYIDSPKKKYNIAEDVYVWDEFLENEHLKSMLDYFNNQINWRYQNTVETSYCEHTIWGNSFNEQKPKEISKLISIIESKTKIKVKTQEYVGVNGQTKGMNACPHQDCDEKDKDRYVSFILFLSYNNADGDLNFWSDKLENEDYKPDKIVESLAHIPNRLIFFNGRYFHNADAPNQQKLRISFTFRGFHK
jgi:hypothetical protein